jgi:hypothetical protein
VTPLVTPPITRAAVVVVALTLCLSVAVVPVAGQSGPGDPDLDALLSAAVAGVNADGGYEAPGYVAGAVAGPTNLHVHDGGTVHHYSFVVTDETTVEEFRAGERDDARTRITADRSVLEAVAADDDPAAALAAAYAAGDVRVDGVGLLSGLKWAVLNLGYAVLGALGLAPA